MQWARIGIIYENASNWIKLTDDIISKGLSEHNVEVPAKAMVPYEDHFEYLGHSHVPDYIERNASLAKTRDALKYMAEKGVKSKSKHPLFISQRAHLYTQQKTCLNRLDDNHV